MLVLSRKKNESIRIGDDIVVTLVRIGPNSARLGITAPRGVHVVREELLTQSAEGDESKESAAQE